MLGDPIIPGSARALVTGASSGIGAEFAEQLAALGYEVILVARNERRLAEAAAQIEKTHGVKGIVLPADLAAPAGLDVVLRKISEDAQIDIVVNSAGTASWGRVVELDSLHEQRQIDVNVTASHRISWAAVRAMQARGRGGLINVASMSAFTAQPYLSTYCGTKAFLQNFTEALHEEMRGTGVVVQSLCPGFTRTNIFTAAGADMYRMPSFIWLRADNVVRRSLADLRRGRAISVPGLRYRFASLMIRTAPRWLTRRIMGNMLGRFDEVRLRQPTADVPSPGAIQ